MGGFNVVLSYSITNKTASKAVAKIIRYIIYQLPIRMSDVFSGRGIRDPLPWLALALKAKSYKDIPLMKMRLISAEVG